MRLPAAYNADVGQYYACTSRFFPIEKYKVLHHTLGPVKPWKWWAYPIFDQNWHWVELRNKLMLSSDVYIIGPMNIMWATSVNLFLLILLSSLRFFKVTKPDWFVTLKLKRSHFSVAVAMLSLLSYVLGFTVIPDTMHPYFAIPLFCLWTFFFLQLLSFFVGLVTCTTQACCFRLKNSMFFTVFLLFIPLVVPLYVPDFFTRVCVFLTLVVLCALCNHFIVVRSLHQRGQLEHQCALMPL